ncbi:purple acid phosphatase family protein [Maribellus maritimus]|uniref:purple acid phosphatase family protein n=1 Tax=Maribellus maritimus TaxID=2870838 RepID=UPI001EECC820|nr:metallophosphoesterase family protein [Maribellus maritimus]MCG6188389.1 metallophosphoesterase family protein [Maribellus maritimus]
MKWFKIVFIGCIFVFHGRVNAQEQPSTNNATVFPDRVMLSISGNPASERAVSWRTSAGVAVSLGQIAKASEGPFFSENIATVNGTSSFWEEGDASALGHKVVFDNLSPNTTYTYRVGNGDNWSEWFQFTTSSANTEPFHFLYLGDFQTDIKQHCSRLIRQAYTHFPNAEFILMAGDLVSRSNEDYWNEFFYAGDWIYGTIPTMATPGNHEYHSENDMRVFSKHWNQIFVNPSNGPEGIKNRSFYIDYQGVRFVSFDSPVTGYYDNARINTEKWLHEVLANNPNKWTVVFTHYPVYSCSQGRDSEDYRKVIQPILEKYGVDLVLQGHDHTYCRGQNLENIGENCINPPMYMVSVAGPKMYGLNVERWSERAGSQIQLYQNVSVDENKLKVDVYTVTGELYDSFSLEKNKKGINKVIESPEINKIRELTQIPENAKHRYTEEEKNLYRERFEE